MRNLLERYGVVRNADGGAGGGGGTPQGGTGAEGGGSVAGSFQYPQGYPDALKGATVEESLGKLFGGFTESNTRAEGLRTKLAQAPKGADKPELYTWTPDEKVKPFFGDLATDAVFGKAQAAAHKLGMPVEMFSSFIGEVVTPLANEGLLSAPFNPKAEIDSFMAATGLNAEAATTAFTEAETFANGLVGQLKGVPESLKADVQAHLVSLTDTAAGNILLRALSGRLAENGIRIGGEGGSSAALTPADVKALSNDPRIDPTNEHHTDPARRYDPALRARYDEAYKRNGAKSASW